MKKAFKDFLESINTTTTGQNNDVEDAIVHVTIDMVEQFKRDKMRKGALDDENDDLSDPIDDEKSDKGSDDDDSENDADPLDDEIDNVEKPVVTQRMPFH